MGFRTKHLALVPTPADRLKQMIRETIHSGTRIFAVLSAALLGASAVEPPPDLQGFVEPIKQVSVSSPVLQDVITAVLVEEGNTVKEGDVLVQLRSDREELVVERTQKQVELADWRAKGLEKLTKEGIGSREKMLEEKANLELAQILNREAKVALNEKTIRAPLSGIVVKKYKEAGESVDRVEKLVDIVNIDQVYVRFYVEIALLERLKIGDPVEVQFPLLGNAEYTGKIAFIDPRIEATTGKSFRLKVLIENPQHRIKAGMRGSADFSRKQTASSVPSGGSPPPDGGSTR